MNKSIGNIILNLPMKHTIWSLVIARLKNSLEKMNSAKNNMRDYITSSKVHIPNQQIELQIKASTI